MVFQETDLRRDRPVFPQCFCPLVAVLCWCGSLPACTLGALDERDPFCRVPAEPPGLAVFTQAVLSFVH